MLSRRHLGLSLYDDSAFSSQAFSSGIAVTLLEGFGLGLGFRCAGLFSLVAFISITLAGTVPINQGRVDLGGTAPTEGWRAMINRWERLDTARTRAAIAAFSLFLANVALR